MNEDDKKTLLETNVELAKVSNTIGDFHALLSNHISDYGHQFEMLKSAINAYKWWLVVITVLVVVALGGFVAMAVTLIIRLFSVGMK